MSLPSQAEFVQAVLDHLGLTQTDLGVELRKPNAYTTVHGWLTGRKRLDYTDTMRMLERCGWLNMSVNDVRPPTEEETGQLAGSRQEIAALLRRLQELTGG